jgi:hypothetical protein
MEVDVRSKIGNLIARDSLEESHVVHLMILLRKTLDHMLKSDGKKFPTIRLYCNWSVHTFIDQSQLGEEIIINIHEKIVELMSVSDNNRLIRELSKLLSWTEFKTELVDLLAKIGIADVLTTDDSKWKQFIKHILEIIRDSPLRAKSQAAIQTLSGNPLRKEGSYIHTLSVESVSGSLMKRPTDIMCIRLKSNDDLSFVVPLTLS